MRDGARSDGSERTESQPGRGRRTPTRIRDPRHTFPVTGLPAGAITRASSAGYPQRAVCRALGILRRRDHGGDARPRRDVREDPQHAARAPVRVARHGAAHIALAFSMDSGALGHLDFTCPRPRVLPFRLPIVRPCGFLSHMTLV
eukprot:gene1351-biopygen485